MSSRRWEMNKDIPNQSLASSCCLQCAQHAVQRGQSLKQKDMSDRNKEERKKPIPAFLPFARTIESLTRASSPAILTIPEGMMKLGFLVANFSRTVKTAGGISWKRGWATKKGTKLLKSAVISMRSVTAALRTMFEEECWTAVNVLSASLASSTCFLNADSEGILTSERVPGMGTRKARKLDLNSPRNRK